MVNADCSKPGICVGSKSGNWVVEGDWGMGVITIGVILIADWGDGRINVAGLVSMLALVSVAVGCTAVAVFCDSFCVHANKNRHSTKVKKCSDEAFHFAHLQEFHLGF